MTITATDLFAGAGGASEGLAQSGIDLKICANHNPLAIATHRLNHPGTEHRQASVQDVDWRSFPSTDILWASPSCFPAGHLVTTARGQVPIEDVEIGDLALTHTGQWRAIVDKSERIAPRTIIIQRGGQYGLETTPEHPFYTKTRKRIWNNAIKDHRRDDSAQPDWKTADQLSKDDYLATPLSTEPLPVPQFNTRGLAINEDFWWMIGRYLGDGYLRYDRPEYTPVQARPRTPYQPAGSPCVVCGEPAKANGNSPNKLVSPYCSRTCKTKGTNTNAPRTRGNIIICCGHHETDELRERLSRLNGMVWNEKQNRTAHTFTAAHMNLVEWIIDQFGRYSHGKEIPSWVFGMPDKDREALLAGYVSADGHTSRMTSTYSVSRKLNVGIRILATTLGKIATSSKPRAARKGVIEGRQVNSSVGYPLQWTTNPDPTKARTYADELHRWHPTREATPGRTDVTVYNLEVEEDHSYVIDGIVVHNCVHHAPSGGRRRPTLGTEMLRNSDGAVDRATAFAVIAAAEVHHYPVILIENVPEFASWTLYRWWLDGLRMLGYTVTEMVLDAADFAHAQHRRRLFITATAPGVDMDLTPPELAPVYADDILEDDPGKPVTRKLYVADQIAQINPADPGLRHLVTYRRNAKALRVDAHRLPTVTAGGNHHGLAYLDHSGLPWHRMLTNRECARAQGFGDDYVFLGTKKQQKFLIGNAVPVGIARWLGERAVAALS